MSSSALVVGAGVIGLSVSCSLAARGWDVVSIDKGPEGQPAASRTPTRYIRFAHGSNWRYSRMVPRSLEMWRRLEDETDERLVVSDGVAWIAGSSDPWLGGSIASLEELGVAYELRRGAEGNGVVPGMTLSDDESILLETNSGLLRAEVALRALVGKARKLGVRFRTSRALPDGDVVRIDQGRRLEADVVIWAVGAWLGELFPDLVPAQASRQDTIYLEQPIAWADSRVPAWIDVASGLYGTPDVDGLGIKLALDSTGREVTRIGDDDPAPCHATEQRCFELFRRRFPGLPCTEPRRRERCYYGLTPDSEWVLDRHPEHRDVWLLGGDSGHGFKHAPQIGELVTGWISEGEEPDSNWRLGQRSARASDVRTSAGAGAG